MNETIIKTDVVVKKEHLNPKKFSLPKYKEAKQVKKNPLKMK